MIKKNKQRNKLTSVRFYYRLRVNPSNKDIYHAIKFGSKSSKNKFSIKSGIFHDKVRGIYTQKTSVSHHKCRNENSHF